MMAAPEDPAMILTEMAEATPRVATIKADPLATENPTHTRTGKTHKTAVFMEEMTIPATDRQITATITPIATDPMTVTGMLHMRMKALLMTGSFI